MSSTFLKILAISHEMVDFEGDFNLVAVLQILIYRGGRDYFLFREKESNQRKSNTKNYYVAIMAMQNLIFESFLREFEGTFFEKKFPHRVPRVPDK